MPLEVCRTVEEDIETVSYLLFHVFAENPMHKVIFPKGATPITTAWNVEATRKGIQEDKNAHHMCVKDTDTGKIISYAVWYAFLEGDVQASKSCDGSDCPSDANSSALREINSVCVGKRRSVMGKRPYMYLADLVTTPAARRRGAGSLLLDWGKVRADSHGIPCYLHAAPEGVSLYKTHGFEEIDQVVVDLRPWNSPILEVVNLAMLRPATSSAAGGSIATPEGEVEDGTSDTACNITDQ